MSDKTHKELLIERARSIDGGTGSLIDQMADALETSDHNTKVLLNQVEELTKLRDSVESLEKLRDMDRAEVQLMTRERNALRKIIEKSLEACDVHEGFGAGFHILSREYALHNTQDWEKGSVDEEVERDAVAEKLEWMTGANIALTEANERLREQGRIDLETMDDLKAKHAEEIEQQRGRTRRCIEQNRTTNHEWGRALALIERIRSLISDRRSFDEDGAEFMKLVHHLLNSWFDGGIVPDYVPERKMVEDLRSVLKEINDVANKGETARMFMEDAIIKIRDLSDQTKPEGG